MDSFDFRRILRTPLAENILYNGETVRAVVTRNERSNITIQGVSAQSFAHNIIIEISSVIEVNGVEEGRVVIATKLQGGDTVRLIDLKGVLTDYKVINILRYDALTKYYKLGLS